MHPVMLRSLDSYRIPVYREEQGFTSTVYRTGQLGLLNGISRLLYLVILPD